MDRFVTLHDLVDEDVAPAGGGAVEDQALSQNPMAPRRHGIASDARSIGESWVSGPFEPV